MIERVMTSTCKPEVTFYGLSTDIKPTKNVDNNATFFELDTKKTWVYSENNINPATSKHWWEV